MKSRLEEDLRIGDLEGLIMDKFQVDSFQPKFCDEKDVAVVAFLVTRRESAAALSDYITRGPFNFLNVEASSSPDEGGNYVVLAELDRSPEMFNTIDQLLRYIDQQVHIRDWYFKPYTSDRHIPWSRENFVQSVPQNPGEFQSGKNGDSKDRKPAAGSTPQKADGPETDGKKQQKDADSVNYSLLARIVEREISKSSRSYFVEFQKQFRKVSKDNRRLLHHFKEIKTDHRHLIKQLDLHQRREKLALMREQQDVKRIRDLEDRLTYLLFAGSEKRKISVTDANPPTIAFDNADTATAESDAEEIIETQIDAAEWPAGTEQSDPIDPISGEAAVEEAEILPPDSATAELSAGDEAPGRQQRPEPEAAGTANDSGAEGTGAKLDAGEPPIQPDDSPVSAIFRQAMEASEQKNYPQAIKDFTRITEISPDEPRAFYNLAILYFRLADYERAEQCASAAIDLGADGARKILKKVSVKKSRRKAGSAARSGIGDDGSHETDRARGRGMDSRVRPADDLLSGFEEKTVEIDGPPFNVPAAPQGETTPGPDRKRDIQIADTEALKEQELPSFGGPGSDDTIVIDPATLAAVKQDNESSAAAEPAGQEESPVETMSPADSPVPAIAKEPFDIDDMPTASLEDFIQAEAGAQETSGQQSAVEKGGGEEQPAGEDSGKAAAPATPEAEMETHAAGASVEEHAAQQADAMVDTEPVEIQPDVVAEIQPGALKETKVSAAPVVLPEEDSRVQKASPPVVDMDLFTRGLAASKKRNYAEALQHFTQFVEQNPGQPRGYYNLAILHYRLKDFETARDMARKALDMGVGSAQKVYEKSQIRLAKERSVLLDNIETASTDTIFEELDTAAFETIDPSSLEEIPVTDALVQSSPAAESPQEEPPEPVPADASKPPGEESEIDSTAPADTDPQHGGDQAAEPIPEFPVLTGDIAQQVDISAGDPVSGAAEEDLPEVEATPIPEPAAAEEGLDAAAAVSEPPEPMTSSDEQPVETAVQLPVDATLESKTDKPEADEQKVKPPEAMPSEAQEPAQPEAEPDTTSEALFAEGMKAYADKNFDQAIEIFNRFISLRSREPRGYYNLAIVYYRKKDYSAAKANAEKAVKLGARAANKVLQKIAKKKLNAGAAPPAADAAGKKRRGKRPAAGKASAEAAEKTKPQPRPAATPGSDTAAAAPISTPEPVESPAIGDIADYDTATFDIAEVFGHDPVVWDADDMEEEVDTSEVQPPLVGDETSDDVIVFESAAAAESPTPPGAAPAAAGTAASKAADKSGSTGDGTVTKAKTKSGGGSDVPGSDLFSLGLAASEKKEYLKAIRYFKKFTDLSPEDPRGYYNLAVVSYRLKSYETAREHAKRAVELGSKPAAKILTKLKSMKVAA